MKSIRYGIHLSALIVAVLLFQLAKDLHLFGIVRSIPLNDVLHNALMGALYASVIVVSLEDRPAISTLRPFGFILLTVGWSALLPIIGWWGSARLPVTTVIPRFTEQILFVLIAESALGSAGLWLLIRWFWKKSLRRVDLFRTVILCVAMTPLVYFAVSAAPGILRSQFWVNVFGMLITTGWWLAFSIALYWSDRNQTVGSPVEIIDDVAVVKL